MLKRIRNRIDFLKRWAANPLQVGAIFQTSKVFTNKMLDEVNWDTEYILELGPGLGNLTQEILVRKKDKTVFKAIEIDKVFCKQLKKKFPEEKFPNSHIIQGSACDLEKIMPELVGKVHVVVSVLPLMSFKKDFRKKIIDSVQKMLTPNGYLLQGSYHVKPPVLSDDFEVNKLSTVWKNVPPIRVYKYDLKK